MEAFALLLCVLSEAPCDTKCICPPRKHLSSLNTARIRFNWTLELIKQRRRIRFSENIEGDRLTLFWIRWWAVGGAGSVLFQPAQVSLKRRGLPSLLAWIRIRPMLWAAPVPSVLTCPYESTLTLLDCTLQFSCLNIYYYCMVSGASHCPANKIIRYWYFHLFNFIVICINLKRR